MKYILVQWPESQQFMEEPWFQEEAILAQSTNEEQEWIGPSAYFIPEETIQIYKILH